MVIEDPERGSLSPPGGSSPLSREQGRKSVLLLTLPGWRKSISPKEALGIPWWSKKMWCLPH